MSNAVELVHRHLECLKFVGGRRDDIGTGQGVELAIVLLPDLLLDVRRYNFKSSDKRKLVVGGRAARMACVLLRLLGDDDGTFQPYLLTKTASLGLRLLETELATVSRSALSTGPFLEYVLPRPGEPRCAIRDDPKVPVLSTSPSSDDELSDDDLGQGDVRRLLHAARTMCLASVTTPNFSKLFTWLLNNVKPSQGFFLDSRRSVVAPVDLTRLLRGLHARDRIKITGVFLRQDEEAAFLGATPPSRHESMSDACAAYKIPFIEYGVDGATVFLPDPEGTRVSLPGIVPVMIEGTAECFKAGVLLAWSVYRTVSELPGLQWLKHEWPPAPRHWLTVLQYATALTDARSASGQDRCTLPDLLKCAVRNSDHLPEVRFQPKGWLVTQPVAGSGRRVALDGDASARALTRLAGFRRAGALRCPDLPLCERPRCPLQCAKKGGGDVLGAVLLDLDGTLMDSPVQRDRALAAALAELTDDRPIPERVRFFTEHVYRLSALYSEEGLSLGDFRQQWNHPASYITYLVLVGDAKLLGGAEECARQPLAVATKTRWQIGFREAYDRVQSDTREEIAKAVAAFDRVRMYPFKEAYDLLESLTAVGPLALYVVSEGHPATQWAKLVSTGLARFFCDREHVLTTGDAVETLVVRESLRKARFELDAQVRGIRERQSALAQLRRRLKDVEFALLDAIRGQMADEATRRQVSRITDDTYNRELRRITERLGRLKTRMETVNRCHRVVEFVEHVIERMKSKNVLSFYASAIRAILRDPAAPRSMLTHFEHLIDPTSPNVKLKFAIVGDRQRNDIEPPTKLLGGNIITIRLSSPAYSRKEPVDVRYDHPPVFLADTLAQAKAVLLAKEPWSNIACSSDPPIFNWVVDTINSARFPNNNDNNDVTIGLDHITCGCRMLHGTYPFVSRICAGILVEHLARREEDRDRVLREYLDGADDPNQAVARVTFTCALLRTGAFYQDPLAAYQEAMARRIAADARLVKGEPEVMNELRTVVDDLIEHGQPAVLAIARTVRNNFRNE